MIRLTLEREKRNWTKVQLGFQANIHPATIGKLEAGKIYPYKPWKISLSKVFNISGDDLFEEV